MRTFAVSAVAVLLCSSVPAADLRAPAAVSPGAPGEVETSASPCPLFSWAVPEETAGFELMVVVLDELPEAKRRKARTVLETRLPGGARAWSPPPDRCLDFGATYAWTVRSVGVEAAGLWSKPLIFAVAPRPSSSDVQQATEILVSWLSVTGGQAAPESGNVVVEPIDVPEPALTIAPDVTAISALFETLGGPEVTFGAHGISSSTTAASAGAVGEARASSGIVGGVIGQVASAQGIAGVFDNTGGGVILETRSGAGIAMQVNASGAMTAPIFSGKGSGLTGVSDLACSECVQEPEIGNGSVTAADLATGSVGASQIVADAVGTDQLATNAVGSAEIATNAVGSAEIAADSVGTGELAEGAVGASEIAAGAVTLEKVDGGAVTRGKLQGLEKMVRSVHADCPGTGKPTRELRCSSVVCQTIPLTFLNCSGGCTATLPELCDNIDKGLLLDPNMDL